ncbi:MAG: NAD-dependent epimerase/dehydratase family protein [Actinomycetota bacterium]|nr:NAD-dependent epimerase/dehydratase family protein [Actinomycetota bacterium]
MSQSENTKRRVLITGVAGFLGLRLAKRLEDDDSVESLVGVDLEEPPVEVKGLDFVRADIRSPLIARVLESTEVDTLIHTNITSRPTRLGGRSQMKENNVIGTMQLLAAAQRADRIKKVVMKSSTAVYGSSPEEPSIIPENHTLRHVDLSGYGKDCAEAETYARDFGRRRKDVDLVILRTQNVVGPTVRTNITDYLSLPVVPTALGFDPRLQLLHEEDAVEALYEAMTYEGGGIFNISGDGVVYLSKALRLLGRPPLPLPLPTAQFAAGILKRLRLVDFPMDQLRIILFGRVVDTRRAKETLGFTARYTTEESVLDFRNERQKDGQEEPTMRPTWERELLEYLKQKAGEREPV